MRVLIPSSIDDATLISSSIAETDYLIWSTGTEYALGDRVILTATHRVYESAHDDNLGNDPTAGTHWLDIGPTNRWAMFDQAVGTATTAAGSVSVVVEIPAAVDAISVLDAIASTIRIRFDDFDHTYAVAADGSLIADGLAAPAGAAIAVTVAGTGQVAIGTMLVGTMFDLGCTEDAPTSELIDYSVRTTDDFGVTTITPRDWAKKTTIKSLFETGSVDSVRKALEGIRATPALWIGETGFDILTTYGFYSDLSLDLELETVSYCSLTITGLPSAGDAADLAPGDDSGFRVLKPITVTDAILASSSIDEDDQPEWDAAAIYVVGARVILTSTHRVYESAAANNQGNDPATSDSSLWIDVGSTSRWAMFDQALGSQATATGAIYVTLEPGQAAGALAFLDTNAASIRVRVTIAGVTVYDQTKLPDGVTATLFEDLPTGATASIDIAIIGPAIDGPIWIGTALIGNVGQIGTLLAEPSVAIQDYSVKTTDDFGVTTVVQRSFAKTLQAKVLVDTSVANDIVRYLASVRAMACLWIGDAAYDSLTLYGFFKDASIELSSNASTCSLTIEGLTVAELEDTSASGVLNWTRAVYANAATIPDTPKNGTGISPTGWSGTPPDLVAGQYRWWSQAEFRGDAQLTNWTTPVKVAGTSWDEVIDNDPDHPKPADGATVGAPAGTTVGDILAETIAEALKVLAAANTPSDVIAGVQALLDRAQTNAIAQYQAQLLEEARKARVDSLTHLNGIPLGTRVVQEIDARQTADEAIITSVNDLSVRVDDGLSDSAAALGEEATLRAAADAAEVATRTSQIAELTTAVSDAEAAITAEADTRSTADEAEATTRSQQVADLQTDIDGEVVDRQAALTAEATARADAVEAETTARQAAISTLNSAIADVIASVSSEANTRATADEAETSTRQAAISALNTDLSEVAASVSSEATTRAAADAAETTAREDAISTLHTDLSSATGAITAEASTRATADEAETAAREAAISTLSGQIGDTEAAIASEATTRADQVSAETDAREAAISTVTDGLAAANAAIDTESTTRATAVETEATTRSDQVAALTTALSSTNAAIESEATTRADDISAEITARTAAIAALQVNIDGETSARTAAIGNEVSARVDADGALAGSISVVSTTVDDHTATIALQAASIDGLSGRVGVSIDVNGHLTGWLMNNDGETGEFAIVADKFSIVDTSGLGTEYSAGNWRTYHSNGNLAARFGVWS